MPVRESLVESFVRNHPQDAAEALATMPVSDVVQVLDSVSSEFAAAALRLMPLGVAADSLAASPRLVNAATEFLSIESVANLVRSLPQEQQQGVLERVPETLRGRLARMLQYPPASVGAVMEARLPAVPTHWTIDQVVAKLPEIAYPGCPYIYVVDGRSALIGVLKIDGLDPADRSPVEDRMRRNVVRIPALAPLSSLADHPGWQHHDCLPVVGERDAFVGVLRHKRVRRSALAEVRPLEEDEAPFDAILSLGEAYWTGLWETVALSSSARRKPEGTGGRH